MNEYLILVLVLFLYMTFWYAVSLIKKRNDVADIAWGLGFVLLAWTSFFLFGNFGVRGLFVNILVSIWGLRLAFHIYSRNIGKTEDYRYLAWRKEWGKWFYIRSYLQVYLLQGALLFLIILPVLLINKNLGPSLGVLDLVGIAVWLFGFYFEVVGDAQLAHFIRNPENKGRLLQSGLWSYTRHPNYFGEVALWWGIWLVALSVPSGLFVIVGPLTISFLILKVSGVPMLEKKMAENPEFAEYKRRVSMFFPLPPKRYENEESKS
ncbi:MAG: Steroid 5-alpha reductase [Patescibacteria group bacterium]|jgi:steroid 5-alpha reductase family enzyme|nr:Steroid 5-alpha reductase [Patescibacteria group bacterium]